eukprot:747638-Hanusia_phi.AAC.2
MLVCELLPQTLEKEMGRLRDCGKEEQRGRQGSIMLGLAEGLAYLHSIGIIHKDIKSQNVMLGHDGTAKYIDFGVSKEDFVASTTASTRLAGSFDWMSPERKRGAAASTQSDVYSLGLLVVYVLTMGRLPRTEEELRAIVKDDAGVSGKLAVCCLEEKDLRPAAATVAMSLLLQEDVTTSAGAGPKAISQVSRPQLQWKALDKKFASQITSNAKLSILPNENEEHSVSVSLPACEQANEV